MLAIDLNRDNRKDYVLFHLFKNDSSRFIAVYAQPGERASAAWEAVGAFNSREIPDIRDVQTLLERRDYGLADNPWGNLRIGRDTAQFRPE